MRYTNIHFWIGESYLKYSSLWNIWNLADKLQEIKLLKNVAQKEEKIKKLLVIPWSTNSRSNNILSKDEI